MNIKIQTNLICSPTHYLFWADKGVSKLWGYNTGNISTRKWYFLQMYYRFLSCAGSETSPLLRCEHLRTLLWHMALWDSSTHQHGMPIKQRATCKLDVFEWYSSGIFHFPVWMFSTLWTHPGPKSSPTVRAASCTFPLFKVNREKLVW